MNIALTAVSMLYGGFFLVSGVGQLVGPVLPRTPAAACGFSPAACRGVGLLELLGAAGLLLTHVLKPATVAAAAGLFLLTVAAFVYHTWYEAKTFRRWAPAATAGIMLCIVVGLPLTGVA